MGLWKGMNNAIVEMKSRVRLILAVMWGASFAQELFAMIRPMNVVLHVSFDQMARFVDLPSIHAS